jgi:NADPH:quinone reductase-like Zn-dependent oxidoreductase
LKENATLVRCRACRQDPVLSKYSKGATRNVERSTRRFDAYRANGIASEPKPRATITVVPYDAIEGPQAAGLAHLNESIEGRRFEIPIAAEYPLADAAKAHACLAAGHVLGKLVLRVR